MIKTIKRLTLCALLSLCFINVSAYDFSVKNDDGVTIYYNFTSGEVLTCEVASGRNYYTGDVVIPETVTYDNRTYLVTSIGKGAFALCSNLTSVTIPEGVTGIGDNAFQTCTSLTSVTIPEGVQSIGISAFFECTSLTSVTIPESVTSIGNSAFSNCSSLTSVTIPESVTSLGEQVFGFCQSLVSVNIPNGITDIKFAMFAYCSSLPSIDIPNSITSIGSFAFGNCSSLTSVTIGNSVTSIDYTAFGNCSNLTSITSLNPEPPTCGYYAKQYVFDGVPKDACVLYVLEGSLEAYATADQWKDFSHIEEIDVTSVIGIEAEDEAQELYRYTIDGKRIDNLQKGINIIKYSDGTTKKVLVK